MSDAKQAKATDSLELQSIKFLPYGKEEYAEDIADGRENWWAEYMTEQPYTWEG